MKEIIINKDEQAVAYYKFDLRHKEILEEKQRDSDYLDRHVGEIRCLFSGELIQGFKVEGFFDSSSVLKTRRRD